MATQRGSGTLSAAIGMTVALTLLLGTVHLVARLHRTSEVGALASDAAHRVAEAGPGADAARRDAEALIRRVLGPDAVVRWREGPTGVAVEIDVPSPSVPGLGATLRRGAEARWERTG